MKRLVITALVLLAAANAPCSAQQHKKKVAVLRFDDTPVQKQLIALSGSHQDVGTGIADLLIQKLVEDGKYSVVDRSVLEKFAVEQNLSSGDLTDPDAAAKIGRQVGVDIIIIGSVTQFGAETKQTTLGGGSNLSVKGFGIGGVQTTSAKAIVVVSARMVDVTTEEILGAATATGESSKSGGITLVGTQWSKSGGGSLDMSSSDFSSSLLGEATHKAVNEVGKQLDAKAGSLPTHASKINALVADVSGTTLIINAGSSAGVQVGDQLTISRFVRQVKDPATGQVLKTVTTKVGVAKVTEVEEGSATLTLTATVPAQVGDMATSPQ